MKKNRDNENDDREPTKQDVVSCLIIDGSYFFTALYNKMESKWKKRSTLEKHKNSYFDGYEFINFYFENIQTFIRELIVSFKMQSNIENTNKLCKVYLTRGSKTSWRNNVLRDYEHSVNTKIIPLLDIIFKDNIGLENINIYQTFNLESDDCIAILVNKLIEKHPNIFINIISKNKRLVQIEGESVHVVDINNTPLRDSLDILSASTIFTPNKYLFFLILKGDDKSNITPVFEDDKTDIEYEQYYDNNDLLAEECEDIILAERLRNNYLVCDYNSIPKKLAINFIKNNPHI